MRRKDSDGKTSNKPKDQTSLSSKQATAFDKICRCYGEHSVFDAAAGGNGRPWAADTAALES